MMELCVTIDIDWASEAAITRTLDHFDSLGVPVTIFSTHPSARVRQALVRHEVGLHPFFGHGSDHGSSAEEVVATVLKLPHNLLAYRCHRFERSYLAAEAMARAGMKISSNTCADIEYVGPYRDRSGLLEVPIFLEDGGYLARSRSLEITDELSRTLRFPGAKVLVVHPMHFCANSPNFGYMRGLKDRLSRRQWSGLTEDELDEVEFRGRGIRNLMEDIIGQAVKFTTLGGIAQSTPSMT